MTGDLEWVVGPRTGAQTENPNVRGPRGRVWGRLLPRVPTPASRPAGGGGGTSGAGAGRGGINGRAAGEAAGEAARLRAGLATVVRRPSSARATPRRGAPGPRQVSTNHEPGGSGSGSRPSPRLTRRPPRPPAAEGVACAATEPSEPARRRDRGTGHGPSEVPWQEPGPAPLAARPRSAPLRQGFRAPLADRDSGTYTPRLLPSVFGGSERRCERLMVRRPLDGPRKERRLSLICLVPLKKGPIPSPARAPGLSVSSEATVPPAVPVEE